MANCHLVANDQRMRVVRDMEHTEVLDVGPVTDPDVVHVPADDGMEPDAAVSAQHDIANDDAGLFYEAGVRNCRFDALKGADHPATVGESARDLQGQLIDRLFNRPVDCSLCHHD